MPRQNSKKRLRSAPLAHNIYTVQLNFIHSLLKAIASRKTVHHRAQVHAVVLKLFTGKRHETVVIYKRGKRTESVRHKNRVQNRGEYLLMGNYNQLLGTVLKNEHPPMSKYCSKWPYGGATG